MTTDFGHLKRFDPRGRKAWFPLPINIPGDPELQMCHAGRTNRPYTAEIMRRNAKNANRRQKVDIDALDENLQNDRELFPEHVIVGWRGVLDAKGHEVKFSKAKCVDFIAALPDWLFQEVSVFAARASNFIPENSPTATDAATQAGN